MSFLLIGVIAIPAGLLIEFILIKFLKKYNLFSDNDIIFSQKGYLRFARYSQLFCAVMLVLYLLFIMSYEVISWF